MTKKKLRLESAFPEPFLHDANFALDFSPGMSKRFYAACSAMQGILSGSAMNSMVNISTINNTDIGVVVAETAFRFADSLLKQEEVTND